MNFRFPQSTVAEAENSESSGLTLTFSFFFPLGVGVKKEAMTFHFFFPPFREGKGKRNSNLVVLRRGKGKEILGLRK